MPRCPRRSSASSGCSHGAQHLPASPGTAEGPVAHVVLDRPEVRNAFNPALVEDLHAWASTMDDQADVRAAVLSGAGHVFCAGGDLGVMAAQVNATRDENLADAKRMAAMFDALDRLAVPLVGRVHGAALGGGAGLASVCDIVVAAEDAVFGFTEVKLGIVPSVISPYALARDRPLRGARAVSDGRPVLRRARHGDRARARGGSCRRPRRGRRAIPPGVPLGGPRGAAGGEAADSRRVGPVVRRMPRS